MVMQPFLVWWWRQIRAVLPERVTTALAAVRRPMVEAVATDDALTLYLREARSRIIIGTLGQSETLDLETSAQYRALRKSKARHAAIRLVLPTGRIMQRDVTLPLAAEQDLAAILAYEMDRLTPFDAEALYWDFIVLRRDEALGQIMLRLSIVPQASLRPLFERLHLLEAHPQAIADETGETLIRQPVARPLVARVSDPRLALPLGGCTLLACLLLGLFWHQSRVLSGYERQIDALRAPALEASALRRTIEDRRMGEGIVNRARHRLGDPMQIIAALTDLLPDDAWLTDLSLKQGQLLISGQSRDPAGLIQELGTSPVLRNPGFIAPVTRLAGQNASAFSIRAEIGHPVGTPHAGARP
ncbi:MULTISPECIES: PilN domain-containing protein [Asaia]|nr:MULTISPECIES: PilN domain-containing protein [Asaia]ETC98395.1 hypothetical protein P792_09760 [Asaia sp. SF2.1]